MHALPEWLFWLIEYWLWAVGLLAVGAVALFFAWLFVKIAAGVVEEEGE